MDGLGGLVDVESKNKANTSTLDLEADMAMKPRLTMIGGWAGWFGGWAGWFGGWRKQKQSQHIHARSGG